MIRYAYAAAAAIAVASAAPTCAATDPFPVVTDLTSLNSGTNLAYAGRFEFTLTGANPGVFDGTGLQLDVGREVIIRYLQPEGDLNDTVYLYGFDGLAIKSASFSLRWYDGTQQRDEQGWQFTGDGNRPNFANTYPLPFGAQSRLFVLSADRPVTLTRFAAGPMPEPETWALMIMGFGAIGAAARRRPTLHNAPAR